MAKETKKRVAAKRGRTRKPRFLKSITGADALAILEVLADRNENLAQEIDAIAKELLSQVEMEEVAANVQMELEFLHIEDVWDRSGAKRDGYVDPGDAAWEMFEEALEPFQNEMRKYKQLSMLKEGELTCQGILKGIYSFDKESSTEYKQWAVDAPREYFTADHPDEEAQSEHLSFGEIFVSAIMAGFLCWILLCEPAPRMPYR